MNTIALIPPRPPINLPKQKTERRICSSCDGPLNGTDECHGCSQ